MINIEIDCRLEKNICYRSQKMADVSSATVIKVDVVALILQKPSNLKVRICKMIFIKLAKIQLFNY